MKVALIGPDDRPEIVRMAIRVEERGSEPVMLDPRRDPSVELGPGYERACGHDLAKVRAVYVGDLCLPSPAVVGDDGTIDRAASLEAVDRSRRHLAAWNALLVRLEARARVVNPPETHELHGLKPWESTVYAERALPSPATVATNEARSLAALAATGGEWIRKAMVGGYGYTEAFEPPSDEGAAAAALANGPLMVQRRVSGDNVRAFVVGAKVIGAAETIPADGAEVDSRRSTGRVERVELPDDAERAALAASAEWGLAFSAVDFMRDEASGAYEVLECNSSPFFVNFEAYSGVMVSGALADYLTDRRSFSGS